MASVARPYRPIFGDRQPRAFDLQSFKSASSVARVARDLGVDRADAGEVYRHMRSNAFRNPSMYPDCHRII